MTSATNNELRVTLTEINPLLRCSLCDGYLRDVHTIIECLHSFCYECLVKHFEEQETEKHTRTKSCPVCGVELGAAPMKTGVRADHTVQSIVDKVVVALANSNDQENGGGGGGGGNDLVLDDRVDEKWQVPAQFVVTVQPLEGSKCTFEGETRVKSTSLLQTVYTYLGRQLNTSTTKVDLFYGYQRITEKKSSATMGDLLQRYAPGKNALTLRYNKK